MSGSRRPPVVVPMLLVMDVYTVKNDMLSYLLVMVFDVMQGAFSRIRSIISSTQHQQQLAAQSPVA